MMLKKMNKYRMTSNEAGPQIWEAVQTGLILWLAKISRHCNEKLFIFQSAIDGQVSVDAMCAFYCIMNGSSNIKDNNYDETEDDHQMISKAYRDSSAIITMIQPKAEGIGVISECNQNLQVV